MSNQEFEKRVLKYFLAVGEKKVPFKKIDVLNAIPDLRNNKSFVEIFNSANFHLSQVFGFKIQEIQQKNNKVYIVVPKSITSHLVIPPRKQPEKILLYIVLTYIFMKGGEVPEAILWAFLKKFEITIDEDHDYFGNVRKFLTETFIKQLYLVREKVEEEGGTDFILYYSWGPRSTYEVPKGEMLEYVAELLKRPSKCFLRQFKEVYNRDPSQTPQPGPSQR
ncbi:melanoma-associated antigen D2 [Lutzomyia longipalpis]|uniref:MAGE domain-containing protein n=1 Tax=Lutzomyia longipalpis TaxID=7200 RepID=A0A1B0CC47_LUTLO|nr:melanoma-associated antigen D2 [Lutzomyia longipalpis]